MKVRSNFFLITVFAIVLAACEDVDRETKDLMDAMGDLADESADAFGDAAEEAINSLRDSCEELLDTDC